MHTGIPIFTSSGLHITCHILVHQLIKHRQPRPVDIIINISLLIFYFSLSLSLSHPSLSGPLPPQNLSLGHVTDTSAQVSWDRHPRSVPDGFVVNVTRGLNTRSRYLPDGRLGSYTLRELSPGQHYRLALTAVRNTGQEQVHSVPQHLAFTTRKCLKTGLTRVLQPLLFSCISVAFLNKGVGGCNARKRRSGF